MPGQIRGTSQLALDNSPVTRWRSWEPARPGCLSEIDFGGARQLDTVRLEGEDGQNAMKYRADGMDARGQWTTLSSESNPLSLPTTVNLRREATREISRRGFHYYWSTKMIRVPGDYRRYANAWGLMLVGESHGSSPTASTDAGLETASWLCQTPLALACYDG